MLEVSLKSFIFRTERVKISFEYDPISFLVSLCDDLQEWERFYLLIDNRLVNAGG